ncbi:uncharacterized protein PGTG_05627 [Puccinia graminis f. sp. tritici CRL 75-36-700-3]|uniref:Uncharacterized protein n=1 Tax=Puccinia graminis f. sp. tritici (strain CRL 75-36-700-3 / race SCCL) TaxID=418459 RepID=E3K4Z1_PUCGT|nr:uncharacterized protein PGTG_05627 [Puccinia graminis f. sp. tritici CRL 75-36-700-3]EFP79306.1 hypothetical protein PGTG_05627 [Puccinia graminis f. sp. tritici CRL 75-36-700-3]
MPTPLHPTAPRLSRLNISSGQHTPAIANLNMHIANLPGTLHVHPSQVPAGCLHPQLPSSLPIPSEQPTTQHLAYSRPTSRPATNMHTKPGTDLTSFIAALHTHTPHTHTRLTPAR